MMVAETAIPCGRSRLHPVSARCGNIAALVYKSRFGKFVLAVGWNGFGRTIPVMLRVCMSRCGFERPGAVNGSV